MMQTYWHIHMVSIMRWENIWDHLDILFVKQNNEYV